MGSLHTRDCPGTRFASWLKMLAALSKVALARVVGSVPVSTVRAARSMLLRASHSGARSPFALGDEVRWKLHDGGVLVGDV